MVTSTYNYLATNYEPIRPIRYTSHKTSELRKIYNNIVNISKRSPLYLLDLSLDRQTYALNLKDAAISLHTLVKNFSDPDSSIHTNYSTDSDATVKELTALTDSYNNLLSIANNHSSNQRRASKLIHELDSITYRYLNDLESCGITRNDTGELCIDNFIASQAATDGTIKELFTNPEKIAHDLLAQTTQIAINPMDYLDQKICAYPNYNDHQYPNPYLTSIYSGMLFNYYC